MSGCEYSRGFLVGAFIACPSDRVEEFSGTMSVIDLGVKNLRDFKFGFIINSDGQRQRLNSFREQVWECWFQHGDMENWVYSMETVWKSEGD